MLLTRCAVFARTDLVHAQQAGYSLPEICDGLCRGLAQNIADTLLGNWVIRGRSWPQVNDVIWITYKLAQLLIVYSVAAAANALLAS